jgi:hypothetical protein
MSLLLRCAGLLVGFAVGAGATAATAQPRSEWIPPDDTIVKVEGNKVDGFGIHHYDGSEEFPPTDSEARAECEEYATHVAVVRCRTEVRTWYRDLGQLKRALRHAHGQ